MSLSTTSASANPRMTGGTLEEFTLFPNLPIELRSKIWKITVVLRLVSSVSLLDYSNPHSRQIRSNGGNDCWVVRDGACITPLLEAFRTTQLEITIPDSIITSLGHTYHSVPQLDSCYLPYLTRSMSRIEIRVPQKPQCQRPVVNYAVDILS